MKLNLYSVNDKYIEYLRKFEDKVYDNKEEIRKYESFIWNFKNKQYDTSSNNRIRTIYNIKWKRFKI